jgi:hypothetical protein
MRNFTFFALMLLMAVACKKTNQVISQPGKISGKWELSKMSGSIAGTIKYLPGNGNIREFASDSSFTFTSPGMPAITGTYTLQQTGESWLLQLHYNSDNQPVVINNYINFQNHSLVFLPIQTCCDIPSTTYNVLQ